MENCLNSSLRRSMSKKRIVLHGTLSFRTLSTAVLLKCSLISAKPSQKCFFREKKHCFVLISVIMGKSTAFKAKRTLCEIDRKYIIVE